jgi:hypothetical protein
VFNTKQIVRRKLNMKTGASCETETFSALAEYNISVTGICRLVK